VAKVTLKSAAYLRGEKVVSILAVSEGQIQSSLFFRLGMKCMERKNEDGDVREIWYYDHPTNIMAIRNLKMSWKAQGVDLTLDLTDALGNSMVDLLHPRAVRFYSKEFHQKMGTDPIWQAPTAVDKMAMGLIAKKHPHLASAAVLILIEDYDPEKKAEQIARTGKKSEVWGFCQKMSKTEKSHTGFDFKITLCHEIWQRFDHAHKRYMLDHELMHCGRTEKGRWVLLDHDVQLFSQEVEEYSNVIPALNREVSALLFKKKSADAEGDTKSADKKVRRRKKKRKPKPESD